MLRVVQRADAEVVPGEKEALPGGVPDGEGELAVELIDAGRAPILVKVNEHLRVRGRIETVPLRFQPGPELRIIIDLAVEDDPDRPRFVADGLGAGREVDDAQAGVAEPGEVVEVEALLVGAPVGEGGRHGGQALRGGAAFAPRIEDPGDAAHGSLRPPSSPGSRRSL